MSTLEETINRAAKELPVGWMITITIEVGAGWVSLYDPNKDRYQIQVEGGLNEHVAAAIATAKDHDQFE